MLFKVDNMATMICEWAMAIIVKKIELREKSDMSFSPPPQLGWILPLVPFGSEHCQESDESEGYWPLRGLEN